MQPLIGLLLPEQGVIKYTTRLVYPYYFGALAFLLSKLHTIDVFKREMLVLFLKYCDNYSQICSEALERINNVNILSYLLLGRRCYLPFVLKQPKHKYC